MMGNPYHYEQYPPREPGASTTPAVPPPKPIYQAPPPAYQTPTPVYLAAPLTDQRQPNTAVVVIAWVLTVLTGLYLLPWAIAGSRGKANHWSVFWVNLLLGWTIAGWIAALVTACTAAHRPLAAVPALVGYAPVAALPAPSPSAGWYPDPSGAGYPLLGRQPLDRAPRLISGRTWPGSQTQTNCSEVIGGTVLWHHPVRHQPQHLQLGLRKPAKPLGSGRKAAAPAPRTH